VLERTIFALDPTHQYRCGRLADTGSVLGYDRNAEQLGKVEVIEPYDRRLRRHLVEAREERRRQTRIACEERCGWLL
jgi:serine/threonine protein kinase HipA of HipAB toxin-antitoxin module